MYAYQGRLLMELQELVKDRDCDLIKKDKNIHASKGHNHDQEPIIMLTTVVNVIIGSCYDP